MIKPEQATRWIRGILDATYDLLPGQVKAKAKKAVKWERPPQQWHKINVDAAFDLERMYGGSGIVTRGVKRGVCYRRGKKVQSY